MQKVFTAIALLVILFFALIYAGLIGFAVWVLLAVMISSSFSRSEENKKILEAIQRANGVEPTSKKAEVEADGWM